MQADYHNCTQEIPISLDNCLQFVDPFTWIVKDYPTEVPCSPIMPVRWNILGKWYCAMPGVMPCTAPTQLESGLNCTEEGDFTKGLGKGIFTKSQMEMHRQY